MAYSLCKLIINNIKRISGIMKTEDFPLRLHIAHGTSFCSNYPILVAYHSNAPDTNHHITHHYQMNMICHYQDHLVNRGSYYHLFC